MILFYSKNQIKNFTWEVCPTNTQFPQEQSKSSPSPNDWFDLGRETFHGRRLDLNDSFRNSIFPFKFFKFSKFFQPFGIFLDINWSVLANSGLVVWERKFWPMWALISSLIRMTTHFCKIILKFFQMFVEVFFLLKFF